MVHADPLFVAFEADDFRLAPGSSAVEAGTNAAPGLLFSKFDLDRSTRFVDANGDLLAIVDIGAYEVPEPSAGATGSAALAALAVFHGRRRARPNPPAKRR